MTGSENRIVRPIFIIGVGRSGSSIFHQVFCRHPRVAWLSRLSDAAMSRPWLNRALMHALDYPMLTAWLTRYADPSEAYRYWDALYPGFSRPCRDLMASDVTEAARRKFSEALPQNLTDARRRLLVKVTGWPRIGFLREIFPDALFIHIMRDGRPVASSFLQVDWWLGWRGPTSWLWGDLEPHYRSEWETHDRSFVALAGIQWRILMDALERAREPLNDVNYLDIRYEDLCADPVRVFQEAATFCGLEWSLGFERAVRETPLRSENEKWRRDFTPDQQRTLETVLRPHLVRYGYLAAG
jgi:hypothetical protein